MTHITKNVLAITFVIALVTTFAFSFALSVRADEATGAATTEPTPAEVVAPVAEEALVVEESDVPVIPPVEEPVTDVIDEVVEETPPIEESVPSEEGVVEGASTEAPATEAAAPAPTAAPELSTDKDDYRPGDLATIVGNFFAPLTDYLVKVFGSDENDQNYTEKEVTVTTDENGSFSTEYQLDNLYRPFYEVFVLLGGEQVAATWFRDLAIGTYDQCQNDDGDGYATGDAGCRWTTGNLVASNSTYHEGDATVQRMWLEGLDTGSVHTVTLQYGTTKGGTHAYDFLTNWDWSENWVTLPDLCQGITNCTGANVPAGGFAIPQDPNAGGYDSAVRNMTIRGGTITGITVPAMVNGSYAADSETAITVTFTVDSTDGADDMCTTAKVQGKDVTSCGIALFFGAHVSDSADWGAGNTAVAIPGSPYHVALDKVDGASAGQRDNQMQAAAIIQTGSITIIKDAVPNSAQDFSFSTTGTGLSNFSLDDDANNSLSNTQTFTGLTAGTYTVTEGATAGWATTGINCVDPTTNTSVNVGTRTVSINLAAGEAVTCTYTNTLQTGHIIVDKVTNPSGDSQSFSFTTTGAGYSGFALTDAAVANDQTLNAGTYSVAETLPDGWTQTGTTCVSSIQDSETIGNLELDAGETITCTFTNTKKGSITIEKQTLPDGSTADFSFTGDVAGTLSDGETATAEVVPGTYTSTEGVLAGWDLTGITCDDNDSTVNLGTRTATFNVAAGENVKCTFLNTERGSLTIVKNTVGGNGSFNFTVGGLLPATPNINTVDNTGSVTYNSVAPGTYSAAETVPGAWDLTSATCDFGETPESIDIGAGEHVTCTFVNTKKPTLTLVKTVVNNSGGTADTSDFQGKIDGGNVAWEVAQVVTVGAHTASETNLDGYTASVWGGDCAEDGSVTLAAGENKTCTITNDDQQAYVTVVKVVTNDNGGDAEPDDFDLTLEGNPVTSGVAVEVNPGTYTAGETLLDGYVFDGFSGNCDVNGDITVALGESKTCTLTNDDEAAHVVLNKIVQKDNGGTAGINDFGLTVGGAGVLSGATTDVDANTPIALNEAGLSGYSFVGITGDAKCPAVLGGTVTLDEGETVTCTITNDDQQAYITVTKVVNNNHGGTASPNDFDPSIDQNVVTSGVQVPVNPGTHSIGETLLTGYEITGFSGDCSADQSAETTATRLDSIEDWQVKKAALLAAIAADSNDDDTAKLALVEDIDAKILSIQQSFSASLSIALGESKTCTITNEDIAPTLTVVKTVVNDNGGTADASDFTMSVTATNASDDSFPGDEAGTMITLDAGSYSVDESLFAGYAKTLGADCSGTIAVGESKVCTITNDDIAPKLTVIKHVINDNGGTADASDFSLIVNAAGTNPAGQFSGSETGTVVTLDAGAYGVAESVAPGYTPSFGTDCSGTIAIGEEKTCTVTNDDIAPVLHLRKEIVNDHGGTAEADDWTLTADGVGSNDLSGATPVDSDGTLKADTFTLSESGPSGYDASDWACEGDGTQTGASIELGVGEEATCTITNNDTAPQLIVVKHVINDNGGALSAGNFTMNVTGTEVSNPSFPGAEAPGTTVTLDAGAYTVDETVVGGYIKTLSADCSGTIAVGETKTCTITNNDTPGHFTGGGSVFPNVAQGGFLSGVGKNPKDTRVTHGFTLHCDATRLPNRLEINWGPAKAAQKFHLLTLSTAFCTNNPAIDPQQPNADFDTIEGTGTGRFNGVEGATIWFRFDDAGEPGKNDRAWIRIMNGATEVLDTGLDGTTGLFLNVGNQQAHQDN